MPASILKRPRAEDRARERPTKKSRKFKKQLDYHSSSDEEDDAVSDFQAVNLQDSDDETPATGSNSTKFVADEDDDDEEEDDGAEEGENAQSQDEGSSEEETRDGAGSDITGASSDSEAASDTSTVVTEGGTKRKKRNDPTAFATSISRILSSKLTTTKRSDPVLSRSVAAAATSKALSDSKLEAKARQKLRADRRLALEKGRVRDVLGLERTEESTEAIMEKERKLKKTAQRGVVKLFNAVREAQKRGEEARRDALAKGVVGMGNREEKVSEMSKQGFLDLISSGGKKSAGAVKA
jgi:fusion and transport protein UGO1